MNVHTITKQENRFVIKLDKSIEQIIDSDTRKKLVNAYLKLFSGFAWVNWTKKQSLGCAWQNAFTQCNAFLKTKNKANYATKYLYSVAKAHKAYQSRIIMTNENSPNTINKTPDEIKRLQQYGQKQIREAMDTINLIMTRYNEHIEELTGHEQTSIRTTRYTKSNQKQSAQHALQPQVTTTAMQMPQVKPIRQLQPMKKQHALQPQVATTAKQMQNQLITKLNSAENKQIVQHRINMFIMAKYNQKSA